MKITRVRARVFEWKGETVAPKAHFCTNAMERCGIAAMRCRAFASTAGR